MSISYVIICLGLRLKNNTDAFQHDRVSVTVSRRFFLCEHNGKQTIPHCRTSFKIQSKNRKMILIDKIDIPKPHTRDHSLYWFGTGISIKDGGVKWALKTTFYHIVLKLQLNVWPVSVNIHHIWEAHMCSQKIHMKLQFYWIPTKTSLKITINKNQISI